MARYHARCRHCLTRRVLSKHPEQYTRLPSCDCCGKRNYRLDKWMNKRNTRAQSCNCAGYWFPHRKGSLFCHYRADGSGRYPGDADFKDRRMEEFA